jgi:hypothetical protein
MKINLPNLSDNKQILLSTGLNDSTVLEEQTENSIIYFLKLVQMSP